MIPIGARVHHVGCKWSVHFSETERKEKPSWGWATVLDVSKCTDGSFEYQVKKDVPFSEGMSDITYWASYHIDRWEMPK